MPQVIDRMIRVPDAATYATIHLLEKLLNRKPGGSTGTNVYAAFQIMAELSAQGHKGSIVSMLCDPGGSVSGYVLQFELAGREGI